jgi:hypothetical protein
MKLTPALVFTAVAAVCAAPARAAILYSTPASNYTQNFDSLPNSPTNTSLGTSPAGWIDDTSTPGANQFSIPGWYLWHPIMQSEGGANNHQRMRLGTGSANTGAFWSFGASGSAERALGMVSSNTMATPPPITDMSPDNGESYYGARFTNNTGITLQNFTVSYAGEQWRDGGAATPNAQRISFNWKVGATSVQETGFNPVVFVGFPLDFVSPVFTNTGGGAAVDGNGAGRVPIGSVTVGGINWAPGTDLWIRWTDINDAGNDHGLAIDDVTFSANVPEPTGLRLWALAMLPGVGRRRR